MLTILFRTLLIYFVLYFIMRLMGKRQIGELEVTDLVTTLLLSEIASLPITNQELPVSHAIIPMITLLFLEVLFSVLLIRVPKLKFLISATPTVIIHHGILDQRAICSLRISLDELISEIRQQGYTDIEQVDCAILEKNGKLTIVPKPQYAQPTVEQLGLKPQSDALAHIIYSNKSISQTGLSLIGKDKKWFDRQIKKRSISLEHVFCITASSDGKFHVILTQDKEKKQR